jgi:hypothetical protein
MSAICITHGDVDGLTCAAQLLRREGGNCDVIFSNARYLSQSLARLTRQQPAPQRLYITDLPASEEAALLVMSLATQGTHVLWVDHHDWPETLVARLTQAGIQVIYHCSLQTPAGVLLGSHLAGEDAFCEQIGHICYASKQGTPWARNWFMRLASATGTCSREILERLAFDHPMTPEDEQAIDGFHQREAIANQLLAQPPRIETTHQQRLMAVYDTSDTPQIYLGKAVFARYPVQLCLHRITPQKWHLTVGPSHRIDMNHLKSHACTVAPHIQIGGRPHQLYSIDVRQSSDQWAESIHEDVVALVKEYL